MSEKNLVESFAKVKNDINELKSEIKKIADRVNNLAIEVKSKKK